MGTIKLTVTLVMITVFTIALITFGINFGYDNSTNINLADDAGFNSTRSKLESNVRAFKANSSESYEAFQKSTLSTDSGETEAGSQFKVTPANSLSMASEVLKETWNRIFGKGSEFAFIITGILGLLIFIIGLYAYKAWKGNP